MDETKRTITPNNKHPFLILLLFSIGISSFGFEIGATTNRNSRTSSFSSSTTTTTHNTMSSRLSSSSSTTQTIETSTNEKVLLPWRDTNHSPFTGNELKNLVVQAALHEENSSSNNNDDDDDFLDIPGVAWLEHLNLIVGHNTQDRTVAEEFYLGVMGMTRDKGKSFHVNLGRQQFHLATPKLDDEVPHRIHGSVGLVVPDLDALWERLCSARDDDDGGGAGSGGVFENTLFDFYKEEGEVDSNDTAASTVIHVRCPWGNVFRCYSANDRGCHGLVLPEVVEPSQQKMTNLHSANIGVHGADKMGVLSVGQPGIRFVEFVLPRGVSARAIADFYTNTIRCSASMGSTTSSSAGVDCCLVSVGPGIHLVFVEAPPPPSTTTVVDTDDEEALFHAMKGVHLCIYAHNFRALYERLQERSLIWTNPRFTHLDTCDTWEEAKMSRTLRFRHIVDDQNKVLMELEHETRPLRHGQFMKVPYYEPK